MLLRGKKQKQGQKALLQAMSAPNDGILKM